MAGVSNFPNGFLNGITLRGVPIQQSHPGEVFFVNSTTVLAKGGVGGSDGNRGTYQKPFATIRAGINACTANRGDIVLVMPGYTQTITLATEITANKAGCAVVGLGSGSLRPTITFGAAAANIPLTAADMSFSNILHVANFADVASYYTVTGTATPTDLNIENCEFRDTSSILNALKVVTDNATVNALDGFNFLKNKVHSLGTTAATTAISILAAADHMTWADNQLTYAAISNTPALATLSTFICLDFAVKRNRIFRPNVVSVGGTLMSGTGNSTGLVSDNYVWHLDATAGLMVELSTELGFFQNFCPITSAADKSGLINPVAV